MERFDWLDKSWRKIEGLEGGMIIIKLVSGWISFGMSAEQYSTKMVGGGVEYS